jgi:alkylation response protein AidB-like acyl-CoA dehydrogenase
MNFTLTSEARQWQEKLRAFVDRELIPHELEAEMNDGRIAPAIAARHERLAIEMGLSRVDVPKSHGGLELAMLTQVAIAKLYASERSAERRGGPECSISRSARWSPYH